MAEMISKQHLLEQIDTTGKGCEYEGKEFLAYQEAMLAVVELIEKEPAVEKEYDVMFSGTEHIDSPGPAPVVGYRIAAKSWEEAVQKGKFYAEMQHPAFIPFAFAGPVIEVPKEELENLETEKNNGRSKKRCSSSGKQGAGSSKQTLPPVCQPARGTECCPGRAGRSGTGDCAAETLHRNPDVEHGQGKPDCAERRFQSHSGSRSKSGCRSNSGGSNGEEV